VAVKIKLMRLGKMRAPYYRIVVADARTKREGRVIETIGKYHPKEHPSFMQVDADRVAYWLGVGAQPTEPVAAILKVTGDWQRFKGLPAPPPMLVAEPKADKKIAFEAAAREGLESGGGATTPKKKAAPKATADDKTAPAGHAAPPADQPATAAPAGSDAELGTGTSVSAAPQGSEPEAAEAGTGSAAPAGGAADASAAADAADAATSGDAKTEA
jgi:small subunit ribosomal protein S16